MVASPGGHLLELLLLQEAFENYEAFYITPRGPISSKLPRKYIVPNAGKNPLKMLKATMAILAILLREKPHVIMSTGAELAIPTFYLGKLLGSKTVFIETLARVVKPSKTGRAVYPASDLFLVQSKELLAHYGKKAKFFGSII